jgi:hypothetical protein
MTFIRKTAELMKAKIVDLRVSGANKGHKNGTDSGTYCMIGG